VSFVTAFESLGFDMSALPGLEKETIQKPSHELHGCYGQNLSGAKAHYF